MSDETYNTDGFMTTIVNPLTDQRKKIFAMDCEMVTFDPLFIEVLYFSLCRHNFDCDIKLNIFSFLLSVTPLQVLN